MSGKVAKGLRKMASGNRKKYKALKDFYRVYKFDYKQEELPF